MTLTMSQTFSAVGPNITSSFLASGGTGPYTYSVQPGGAGGVIDASTGVYTAPALVPANPSQLYDTIKAVDTLTNMGSAQIFVGDPLLLFCEIIQNQMGLQNGRVYLWDQKVFQPSDAGLYVAVSVLVPRVYANIKSHTPTSGGLNSNQSLNVAATLQIDIMSRDTSALTRKEEVLLALNSDYSEKQQNANSFYIGKIPPGAQFTNLSLVDGAAIPYRFVISLIMQYSYAKTQPVDYMTPTPAPVVNYVQS